MNAADIFELLTTRLGLRKARLSSRGWINASCPFESKHGGGKDESPSFGVHVADSRSSKYNCKSGACGFNGDSLTSLIFALAANHVRVPASLESTFWWVIARDNTLREASERPDPEERKKRSRSSKSYNWQAALGASAGMIPSTQSDGKVFALVPHEPMRAKVLNDSDLTRFKDLSSDAFAYLQGPKRQLTQASIDAWELGSSDGRIVIPMRDHEQRLVGISKRAIDPNTKPKYLHSTGFKRDLLLFGESKKIQGCTARLVEGHFDVIWLWQAGYSNAVGLMGSYPSKEQIEKIVLWFSNVVIFGDGDVAGSKMATSTCEVLKSRIPVRIATPLEGKDPNEHTTAELLDLLGPPDRHPDNPDRL